MLYQFLNTPVSTLSDSLTAQRHLHSKIWIHINYITSLSAEINGKYLESELLFLFGSRDSLDQSKRCWSKRKRLQQSLADVDFHRHLACNESERDNMVLVTHYFGRNALVLPTLLRSMNSKSVSYVSMRSHPGVWRPGSGCILLACWHEAIANLLSENWLSSSSHIIYII